MPTSDLLIRRAMALLTHASACRDPACPSTNCRKMKVLFGHVARCQGAAGCITCMQAHMLLRAHAARCTCCECQVPACARFKQRRWTRAAAEAA